MILQPTLSFISFRKKFWLSDTVFLKEKKKKKPFKQQKSSSHQLRKRGHLGRRAPSPEKKKAVSEDQEGCGQASQQTSPDKLEDEENAEENVWSAQAHEHNAQNEHEA